MRGPLAVCFVLAIGCQAPAGASGTCTFNSECAAPLVCVADRCRPACREARDCPYPMDCVLTAAGVGACQVGADMTCRAGANDCAAPLACLDGRCRQGCEEASECALGMTCTATVAACERPTPIPGACDPLADQGCAAGQTCVIDAGVATCTTPGVTASVRADVGGECTSDGDCLVGLICPHNNPSPIGGEVGRTTRRCLRPCSLDPLSSCGVGARCLRPDQQANGLALVQLPAGVGVCTEHCDPFADTGCPENETCLVNRLSDGDPVYCSTRTPGGTPFMLCGADYECAGHEICEQAPGDTMSQRVCRPICRLDGADTCPTDSHCADAVRIDTGDELGLCVRTVEPPAT